MDVSTLNPNYLSALLSPEKFPSYPMPPKAPVVAPPTQTTANAVAAKPRKPRSDKGVPKTARPPAQAPAPAPSPPVTPRKRKQVDAPAPPPAPVADATAKPKKPRAKKAPAAEATPPSPAVEAAESKPKRQRTKKQPAADVNGASSVSSQAGSVNPDEEEKHTINLSAAQVRYKGMNKNPLDKIPSVNVPPANAGENVLLPGYPTLGSLFAEVYSTHRTVDNRLNRFGEDLTKFMAAQYAANDQIRVSYEEGLEKLKQITQEKQQQPQQSEEEEDDNDDIQQTQNSPSQSYESVDLDDVPTIVPLTP